ncbi:hypothetical protein Bbelb_344660 [Branchiostoma belcheri]|nr:hypothetical protein Bbelb_344660 [Branchiostoma belcheri]
MWTGARVWSWVRYLAWDQGFLSVSTAHLCFLQCFPRRESNPGLGETKKVDGAILSPKAVRKQAKRICSCRKVTSTTEGHRTSGRMVKPGVLWMTILVAICFRDVSSRADGNGSKGSKEEKPTNTGRSTTTSSELWTPYLQGGLYSQISTTDRHRGRGRTKGQNELLSSYAAPTVRTTASTSVSKSSTKRLPTDIPTTTATGLILTNTTDRTLPHVSIRPTNPPNKIDSGLGAIVSRKGADFTTQEWKESAQVFEKSSGLETTSEVPKAEFTAVNVKVPKTQEDLDDSLSLSSSMVVTSQSSTTVAISEKTANTRTNMVSARSHVQSTSTGQSEDAEYPFSSEPTVPLSYKPGEIDTTVKLSTVSPTTEDTSLVPTLGSTFKPVPTLLPTQEDTTIEASRSPTETTDGQINIVVPTTEVITSQFASTGPAQLSTATEDRDYLTSTYFDPFIQPLSTEPEQFLPETDINSETTLVSTIGITLETTTSTNTPLQSTQPAITESTTDGEMMSTPDQITVIPTLEDSTTYPAIFPTTEYTGAVERTTQGFYTVNPTQDDTTADQSVELTTGLLDGSTSDHITLVPTLEDTSPNLAIETSYSATEESTSAVFTILSTPVDTAVTVDHAIDTTDIGSTLKPLFTLLPTLEDTTSETDPTKTIDGQITSVVPTPEEITSQLAATERHDTDLEQTSSANPASTKDRNDLTSTTPYLSSTYFDPFVQPLSTEQFLPVTDINSETPTVSTASLTPVTTTSENTHVFPLLSTQPLITETITDGEMMSASTTSDQVTLVPTLEDTTNDPPIKTPDIATKESTPSGFPTSYDSTVDTTEGITNDYNIIIPTQDETTTDQSIETTYGLLDGSTADHITLVPTLEDTTTNSAIQAFDSTIKESSSAAISSISTPEDTTVDQTTISSNIVSTFEPFTLVPILKDTTIEPNFYPTGTDGQIDIVIPTTEEPTTSHPFTTERTSTAQRSSTVEGETTSSHASHITPVSPFTDSTFVPSYSETDSQNTISTTPSILETSDAEEKSSQVTFTTFPNSRHHSTQPTATELAPEISTNVQTTPRHSEADATTIPLTSPIASNEIPRTDPTSPTTITSTDNTFRHTSTSFDEDRRSTSDYQTDTTEQTTMVTQSILTHDELSSTFDTTPKSTDQPTEQTDKNTVDVTLPSTALHVAIFPTTEYTAANSIEKTTQDLNTINPTQDDTRTEQSVETTHGLSDVPTLEDTTTNPAMETFHSTIKESTYAAVTTPDTFEESTVASITTISTQDDTTADHAAEMTYEESTYSTLSSLATPDESTTDHSIYTTEATTKHFDTVIPTQGDTTMDLSFKTTHDILDGSTSDHITFVPTLEDTTTNPHLTAITTSDTVTEESTYSSLPTPDSTTDSTIDMTEGTTHDLSTIISVKEDTTTDHPVETTSDHNVITLVPTPEDTTTHSAVQTSYSVIKESTSATVSTSETTEGTTNDFDTVIRTQIDTTTDHPVETTSDHLTIVPTLEDTTADKTDNLLTTFGAFEIPTTEATTTSYLQSTSLSTKEPTISTSLQNMLRQTTSFDKDERSTSDYQTDTTGHTITVTHDELSSTVDTTPISTDQPTEQSDKNTIDVSLPITALHVGTSRPDMSHRQTTSHNELTSELILGRTLPHNHLLTVTGLQLTSSEQSSTSPAQITTTATEDRDYSTSTTTPYLSSTYFDPFVQPLSTEPEQFLPVTDINSETPPVSTPETTTSANTPVFPLLSTQPAVTEATTDGERNSESPEATDSNERTVSPTVTLQHSQGSLSVSAKRTKTYVTTEIVPKTGVTTDSTTSDLITSTTERPEAQTSAITSAYTSSEKVTTETITSNFPATEATLYSVTKLTLVLPTTEELDVKTSQSTDDYMPTMIPTVDPTTDLYTDQTKEHTDIHITLSSTEKSGLPTDTLADTSSEGLPFSKLTTFLPTVDPTVDWPTDLTVTLEPTTEESGDQTSPITYTTSVETVVDTVTDSSVYPARDTTTDIFIILPTTEEQQTNAITDTASETLTLNKITTDLPTVESTTATLSVISSIQTTTEVDTQPSSAISHTSSERTAHKEITSELPKEDPAIESTTNLFVIQPTTEDSDVQTTTVGPSERSTRETTRNLDTANNFVYPTTDMFIVFEPTTEEPDFSVTAADSSERLPVKTSKTPATKEASPGTSTQNEKTVNHHETTTVTDSRKETSSSSDYTASSRSDASTNTFSDAATTQQMTTNYAVETSSEGSQVVIGVTTDGRADVIYTSEKHNLTVSDTTKQPSQTLPMTEASNHTRENTTEDGSAHSTSNLPTTNEGRMTTRLQPEDTTYDTFHTNTMSKATDKNFKYTTASINSNSPNVLSTLGYEDVTTAMHGNTITTDSYEQKSQYPSSHFQNLVESTIASTDATEPMTSQPLLTTTTTEEIDTHPSSAVTSKDRTTYKEITSELPIVDPAATDLIFLLPTTEEAGLQTTTVTTTTVLNTTPDHLLSPTSSRQPVPYSSVDAAAPLTTSVTMGDESSPYTVTSQPSTLQTTLAAIEGPSSVQNTLQQTVANHSPQTSTSKAMQQTAPDDVTTDIMRHQTISDHTETVVDSTAKTMMFESTTQRHVHDTASDPTVSQYTMQQTEPYTTPDKTTENLSSRSTQLSHHPSVFYITISIHFVSNDIAFAFKTHNPHKANTEPNDANSLSSMDILSATFCQDVCITKNSLVQHQTSQAKTKTPAAQSTMTSLPSAPSSDWSTDELTTTKSSTEDFEQDSTTVETSVPPQDTTTVSTLGSIVTTAFEQDSTAFDTTMIPEPTTIAPRTL